jgi:hypothetical protein
MTFIEKISVTEIVLVQQEELHYTTIWPRNAVSSIIQWPLGAVKRRRPVWKRKEDLILFFFAFSICYLVKLFYFNFGSILGIILYFLLPLIVTQQSKKYIFITFIIDNIYMILSNYNRDLGITTNNSTFLIEKICLIDYYILILTYYIGGVFMGMSTILPWFSKKETILKAKIKKYETKVEKLKAKLLCSKK